MFIGHLQSKNNCLSRRDFVCKCRSRMPKLNLGTVMRPLFFSRFCKLSLRFCIHRLFFLFVLLKAFFRIVVTRNNILKHNISTWHYNSLWSFINAVVPTIQMLLSIHSCQTDTNAKREMFLCLILYGAKTKSLLQNKNGSCLNAGISSEIFGLRVYNNDA